MSVSFNLQRVEGWAMLAPVKQYDCYISHNGSAAAMTLPTSYNASNPSDSSPAGPGMQQQVLLLSCVGLHTCVAKHSKACRARRTELLRCVSSYGTVHESSLQADERFQVQVQRAILRTLAQIANARHGMEVRLLRKSMRRSVVGQAARQYADDAHQHTQKCSATLSGCSEAALLFL